MFKRRNLLQNLNQGLILGAILWCIDTPQFIGLKFTSSVNSGFITGLFLFFVPIISFILFRKVPNRIQIVALFISLTGLWFLSNGLKSVNIGDMITLITPVAYAIHIIVANKFVKGNSDKLVMVCQELFVVAILSLVTAAFFHLPFGVKQFSTMAIILFLSIFANVFGNVIFLVAQKYTSTIKAGFILSLEPVFAAIFAWTLGHEIFHLNQLFGGALIFLAMIVSQIPIKVSKS
jgi:drug/metabolite transporter (DMT)-like permease